MNRQMIEMLAIALAILLVIILLIIALKRAVKDVWEIENEDEQEKQNRLNFLDKYEEQIESMKRQQTITNEDYEKEMHRLDELKQEIENE